MKLVRLVFYCCLWERERESTKSNTCMYSWQHENKHRDTVVPAVKPCACLVIPWWAQGAAQVSTEQWKPHTHSCLNIFHPALGAALAAAEHENPMPIPALTYFIRHRVQHWQPLSMKTPCPFLPCHTVSGIGCSTGSHWAWKPHAHSCLVTLYQA